MPQARAVPRVLLALLSWAAAACASAPSPAPAAPADAAPVAATEPESERPTARMPREIQLGSVDMAIQRVESDVSRAEIAAVVAPMIAEAPVCMRWPALWIEQARRTVFVVRYDLMSRDWGEAAVASARARMSEFVEMGFLQEQPGADPAVVTYAVTTAGSAAFRGVIQPGARPNFCGPAERRLVAIEALEWGQYPCGTLHVRFTHDGDAFPSWATSEAMRQRLAQIWPQQNAPVSGSVSLSRQWFRREDLPPGAQNGGLRSACYDARRQEIVGDDLDLSLGSID